MNTTVLQMKEVGRAMMAYVLVLYEIVLESRPGLVLEIGVGTKGQSTRTILSALKENGRGRLVSVDDRDGSRKIDSGFSDYWKFICGDSHSDRVCNAVKEIVGDGKIDILFIDGDHSYEGVKRDFETYAPMVKERGLVLMHDITNKNEGVPKFWEEIKYPKISLEYGNAGRGIQPGFGIVQKISL